MQATLHNRFLAALSLGPRERLLSACSLRELPVGHFLYRAEEEAKYCYFLTSGIASVVVPMAEGTSAEVVLVGKEGVTGCGHLLGPAAIPTSCFIQLPAFGFRLRLDTMADIFCTCDETRARILELIQHESFLLSQVAGCNQLHQAEGRLARWLLMAQDRTGSPRLDFTQTFLAQMLGLERTTVSSVAAALQRAGLIEYTRGHLTITNRSELEVHACSCYPTAKKLHHGLYVQSWNRQLCSPKGKRLTPEL